MSHEVFFYTQELTGLTGVAIKKKKLHNTRCIFYYSDQVLAIKKLGALETPPTTAALSNHSLVSLDE